MLESKQNKDTLNNHEDFFSSGLKRSAEDARRLAQEYVSPDVFSNNVTTNKDRKSYVYDIDNKSNQAFDSKNDEARIQILNALSDPKKELILTHDSYLKTMDDEEARKVFERSNIHPYIYTQIPGHSASCKESPSQRFRVSVKNKVGEFFIQKVTRKDAELSLSIEKEGSFLVRESESSPGDLTISIKRQKHIGHVWIGKTKNGKFLCKETNHYNSIENIIGKYVSTFLVSKGGQAVQLSVNDEDIISNEVNDYNSFKKKSYYIGSLSQQACEDRLKDTANGSFLLSEVDKERKWMLSAKFPAIVGHFYITLDKNYSIWPCFHSIHSALIKQSKELSK
ncbi:uncharacterized protein [Clytia hemisphaerica]|uniref:SH2 domain-containing protein n=1 Tax=Clytia hemisphaerica TaxID=252671 RepID=A0A7M5UDP0_9CNID|eukprot:TCONS_00072646-protein